MVLSICQHFEQGERVFDTARHVRQKPFLLSVVNEVVAHHKFLESLRHYGEKYLTNGICYGDRAKLRRIIDSIRLGKQGNECSRPADRYVFTNPDFPEDSVQGVDDGWAAFVRDIGQTIQSSCSFVSFRTNTSPNLVLRRALFGEEVSWKVRFGHLWQRRVGRGPRRITVCIGEISDRLFLGESRLSSFACVLEKLGPKSERVFLELLLLGNAVFSSRFFPNCS